MLDQAKADPKVTTNRSHVISQLKIVHLFIFFATGWIIPAMITFIRFSQTVFCGVLSSTGLILEMVAIEILLTRNRLGRK